MDTDRCVDEGITADMDIPVDEEKVSLPTRIGYGCPQGEGIPADTDRNNTLYNNNNTLNNTVTDTDSISNYPEEKEDYSSLENERDILINEFCSEFGYLEDSTLELITAEKKAERGSSSGIVQRHIKFLRKTIEKWRKAKEHRMSSWLSEYRRAVKATMPKDTMLSVKVNLILDRYINEHDSEAYPIKKWRKLYGVWLNGWNGDLKEPNVFVAMNYLPLDVVAKQRHNIEDIPPEYWKTSIPK